MIQWLFGQLPIQGRDSQSMRPMSQLELEQRQLYQASQMRGMGDDELAQRYGDGLMNAYRPEDQS